MESDRGCEVCAVEALKFLEDKTIGDVQVFGQYGGKRRPGTENTGMTYSRSIVQSGWLHAVRTETIFARSCIAESKASLSSFVFPVLISHNLSGLQSHNNFSTRWHEEVTMLIIS